MLNKPYTRIVIRRPDGTAEVVTRVGLLDPHQTTRDLAHAGAVESVRHESMLPGGSHTVHAIHRIG